MVEFESWLTEKLTNLGTDASVFSPYIVGILEHEVEDICERMHRIMEEKNQSFNSNKKEQTEEEKKLKEAILASYAQVEDDEDEEGETEFSAQVKIDAINNAEQVAKAQQEWRESQKAAAMAKKEKDKQDREKQRKKRINKIE